MSWAPFNSVISGSNLMRELDLQRRKIKKPLLSDTQIEDINNLLTEALQTKGVVELKYYLNGYIYLKKGIIHNINPTKEIIIIDNKVIHFKQVIGIKLS